MARNLAIVFFLFVLAVVAGVMIVFYHPPARMPAGAVRLASIDDPGEYVIDWIDSHTALMRNHSGVFTLNVTTGARSVPAWVSKIIALYPQLNKTAHIGNWTNGLGDLGWTLSPDRHWIAACVDVPANSGGKVRWVAAKLDGTDLRTCPGIDQSTAIWLPDSSGWASVDSADNPDDGTFVHLYRLDKSGIDASTLIKATEDDVPAGEEAAMIAPDTMLFFFDENHRDYDQTMVVKLSSGKTDVVEDDGDPAAGSTMPMSADLSPDGTRILWTYMGTESIMQSAQSMKDSPPFREGVGVGQDSSPDNPPWDVGILITDAHNKGRTVIVPDNAGKYTNPRWMPDNRHISVIHDKALWSIPVN